MKDTTVTFSKGSIGIVLRQFLQEALGYTGAEFTQIPQGAGEPGQLIVPTQSLVKLEELRQQLHQERINRGDYK